MRTVKSAERTLALFELFSLRQRPLTIGMIVKELGIPQPSASMLARNLHAMGYLTYDAEARTYLPTIRIILLGSWISRRFSKSGEISTRLKRLQESYENAHVAIQNGAAIQVIMRQKAGDALALPINSGELRSITCSAAGRALISIKSDQEIISLVRRSNAEATDPRHRVDEGKFMELVYDVRSRGYAETYGDWFVGRGGVAVVIPSPVGDVPFAVSIGGPLDIFEPKRPGAIEALLKFKAEYTETVRTNGPRLDPS